MDNAGNKRPEATALSVQAPPGPNAQRLAQTPPYPSARLKIWGVVSVLLILAFSKPLWDLAGFALHSDLHSHILLIPFVTVYLVWLRKDNLALASRPAPALALLPFAAGVATLGFYWTRAQAHLAIPAADYLAFMTFSLFCFLLANSFCFLGLETLKRVAFPVAMLLFAVPFPVQVRSWIEVSLQHRSADAAYWLLKLSGMPILREGTQFQLPGISVEIAPECSGIHSSLVLFIAALVAAHVLLRRTWTKAVFALAVIPLGIVRNAFRIFVIAQLCVQVSPDWINSKLHSRGGPIFFLISLAPFFLLLLLLRKIDARKEAALTT